jgi:hypothetical protein
VAILSGVRADRIIIQCLMIVGFTALLAGVVSISRLGAVSPNTGEGLEFEVIAARDRRHRSLRGTGRDSSHDNRCDHHRTDQEFPQSGAYRDVLERFATGAIILCAVLKRCNAASPNGVEERSTCHD